MSEMERRFTAFLKAVTGKCVLTAQEDFNNLSRLYSDPQRFYHNLYHIQKCLRELDSARAGLAELTKPDVIEMAIWYHDAVYDTHAGDNEEKSAAMAFDYCLNLGLRPDFAQSAKELILATRHNAESPPKSNDSKIIADIDLAIFGASQREYDSYSANIRKEYSWVQDEQFRQGRKKLLQSFLAGESIYLTDFFKNKYEERARKNLKREIDKLS